MDVNDVEATLVEQPVERGSETGRPADERLCTVDIDRERATMPDDLERLGRKNIGIDRMGHFDEPRSDHGHLVASPRELRCLTVNMLGHASELGVVVVTHDCDPHRSRRYGAYP